MRTSKLQAALGITCIVSLSVGCDNEPTSLTKTHSQQLEPGIPAGGVEAHAQTKVPSATIQDWYSYADAVAVVSIDGEVQNPINAEVERVGSGYVSRTITATVRKVLWISPLTNHGLDDGTGLEMTALGWAYREGDLKPIYLKGGVRLTVGTTYLMPLADFEDGGWSPLSQDAAVPMKESGLLALRATPAGARIAGKPAEAVLAELEGTSPDPQVIPHAHLRPAARYQAVLNSQQ